VRRERRSRFDDLVDAHAQQALVSALGSTGEPVPVQLGREVPARVSVTAGRDVLQVELALESKSLTTTRIERSLRAFTGDGEPLWEVDALGWARRDELGFRLIRKPLG